jgi:murein L,D-transpeptidase YcbB/YkuD
LLCRLQIASRWRFVLAVCIAVAGGYRAAVAEVASAFPASPAHLEAALDSYRAIERQGGWPVVPGGPALRVGSSGPAVALLRERLAITGDFTGPDDEAPLFDEVLAQAVTAFQARHGLEEDGVVGPKTRAALNVPAEARVRQLAANLERLESLPLTDDARTVLINVAAFDLSVLEDGRVAFASPVIVGRRSRPTPVFSSAITKAVVNPYWHVPRLIAVKDILPKVQQDLAYLREKSIRVYRASGAARIEVAPESVDWKSLNANNFPYLLVQDPGPTNALGRVKFYFPNDFDVFLHDTPAQALFSHGKRAFSSGCIRVGKALALAEFLLHRDGLESFEQMADALQKRETRNITLKTPVPLHIVYLTAWTDRDGRAQFRDDVYSLDGLMAATGTSGAPPPVKACGMASGQDRSGR